MWIISEICPSSSLIKCLSPGLPGSSQCTVQVCWGGAGLCRSGSHNPGQRCPPLLTEPNGNKRTGKMYWAVLKMSQLVRERKGQKGIPVGERDCTKVQNQGSRAKLRKAQRLLYGRRNGAGEAVQLGWSRPGKGLERRHFTAPLSGKDYTAPLSETTPPHSQSRDTRRRRARPQADYARNALRLRAENRPANTRFIAQPRGGVEGWGGQGWRVTLALVTCCWGSGVKTQGPGGCSGSREPRRRAPSGAGK